ncbi:MAG TPA: protein kinase [Polyangiaceae bacterium]|jgi:serine/threonine-protein kinase
MLSRGEKLAHYTIESMLGSGGMGAVYLAVDSRLQRRVALKVILESDKPADLKESAARLLREARAAASLTHPNVVAVFDVGEIDGRVYLAMEYVVGKTLRELMRDDALPWPKRLRWLVDVARALAHAHREGLVHRDIKPENVMVRDDGLVKVLDFGIARRAQSPVDPTGKTEQVRLATLTGKGLVVGTPMYMAPEQLKGGEPDVRTDQFSWGVMSYEVLSGERPWPEKSDLLAAVATILTEDPVSLRKHAPDLPPAIEQAIARSLSRNPDDRFESMEDLADLLDPLAVRSGGTSESRVGSRASRPGSVKVTARAGKFEDSTPKDDERKSTKQAMVTFKSPEHPLAPKPQQPRKRQRWPFVAGMAVAAFGLGVYYKYRYKPVVIVAPTATTLPTEAPTGSAPEPTQNAEALAAYREGVQQWRDGAARRSRTSLERATSLDPGFGSANLELAVQMLLVDEGTSRARPYYQKAYSNRERLSPSERDVLAALDPMVRVSADFAAAQKQLEKSSAKFPSDPIFPMLIGWVHEQTLDFDTARDDYQRAISRDGAYMPALYAKAHALRMYGSPDAALDELGKCIDASSTAAICLEERLHLRRDRGDCKGMEDDARAWQSVEPDTYQPSYQIAAALMARKEPIQSVEAALRRAWSALPKDERAANEAEDTANLALAEGDFVAAEKATSDLDAARVSNADAALHSGPQQQLALIAFETGDVQKAARIADDFLKVLPAMTPSPVGHDPTIWAAEYLFRGGRIDKATLDAKRTAWLRDQETNNTQTEISRLAPFRWAQLYAGFAENADEAKEALAKENDFSALPPESRRTSRFEFELGKVYALANQGKDAVGPLGRVTNACIALGSPIEQTRAFYFLGMALETNGDLAGARAAYQTVVDRWGSAKPHSHTADEAKKRLKVLE